MYHGKRGPFIEGFQSVYLSMFKTTVTEVCIIVTNVMDISRFACVYYIYIYIYVHIYVNICCIHMYICTKQLFISLIIFDDISASVQKIRLILT